MALSATGENELLTALHEAPLEPAPFGLFVRRLRARTGADLCRLRIGHGEVRQMGRDDGALEPRWTALRPGRIYAGQELGFAGFSRFVRIGDDEQAVTVALHRSASDFAGRDAALLSGLVPHIAIARQCRAALGRAEMRAAASERVTAMAGLGWVLLDGGGRILDADGSARRMLVEGRMMRQAGDGRLRLSQSGAEGLLAAALEGSGKTSVAFMLSSDPPIEALAVPASSPASLLLVIRRVAGHAQGKATFARLHGLSVKEAALATALAEGRSIAEAGAALGLTLETARNYSKQVYAKTGARRQADLVRMVLSGVSALALPEPPNEP